MGLIDDLDVNNKLTDVQKEILEAVALSNTKVVGEMLDVPGWKVLLEVQESLKILGLRKATISGLRVLYKKRLQGVPLWQDWNLPEFVMFLKTRWNCTKDCEIKIETQANGDLFWEHNQLGFKQSGKLEDDRWGITSSPPRHRRMVDEIWKV